MIDFCIYAQNGITQMNKEVFAVFIAFLCGLRVIFTLCVPFCVSPERTILIIQSFDLRRAVVEF
jgi:hypothetical protein